jgi:hypothetical protein
MTAAYASIPSPSIAEVPDGDPIEITFSIQKYKIPPTDRHLTFLDKNKAKFPIFDTVDTNDGVSAYLYNLLNSDDVGFILKYNDTRSKSYARATVVKSKKPMHVVDHVQLQLPHTRTNWTLEEVEAALAARKNAFSPFRLHRKKLPKSGKKVGKKSDKKSGKVRKNKRKTTL